MATAPEADGSAARSCPGKLLEGPAYSAASGWGLPCEEVAFTRPGPKARWPIVGPQESATTGASRTRVLQCFHEWPSFPDSGLAEPPATRPNQQRPQLGLRVGPEQFRNCEWRRAPHPRRGEGGGVLIFIFIFKFPHCSEMWDNYVRCKPWLQLPTIAVGLPVASRIGT